MKMYKIIAVIAFLFLIPLSTFPMEVVPKELKKNKKLRKKLYAWHKGNEWYKLSKATTQKLDSAAILAQVPASPEKAVESLFRTYAEWGQDGAITKAQDKLYAYLESMPFFPGRVTLTTNEKSKACAVLNAHVKKLRSKITKDENPLQAKWKSVVKAAVVTGVTLGLAHYYLRNKHVVSDMIGNNVISRCADGVAHYYHEAPYRPLANGLFGSVFNRIPWVGWIASHCAQFFADRATGFTHFSSFVQTGKGLLIDLFTSYLLSIPEQYATNQFNKIWNYKSDLINKISYDQAVNNTLQSVSLAKTRFPGVSIGYAGFNEEMQQFGDSLDKLESKYTAPSGPQIGNSWSNQSNVIDPNSVTEDDRVD